MRMLALATLLALTGCGPSAWDHIQVTPADSPYSPSVDDTATALGLFALRAGDVVNDRNGQPITSTQVQDALGQVHITYTTQSLDYLDRDLRDGQHVAGYSFGGIVVVLVDETRHDLGTNALIHELTHSLLWMIHRDPAEGHETDASGLWTADTSKWIDSVMADLREAQ